MRRRRDTMVVHRLLDFRHRRACCKTRRPSRTQKRMEAPTKIGYKRSESSKEQVKRKGGFVRSEVWRSGGTMRRVGSESGGLRSPR